ncbi:DNA primase [Hydrogenophaga sp. T2]|uniref:DNA primase n=1 Tax=Hydrogenophaga sp. T2 TaxID=3132823 RepID=UPI003CFB2D74
MAIPQSFIQELLSRVDVVDVVGRYVQLKKGGANFMGLCPFHGEKSPSFSVSPTKQFYHCFGCGANGNAIGFLMEHVGMGFVEAVKELASQVGLQVPDEDISPQERERAAQQRQQQATLTDVLEKAGKSYQQQLKGSPRAVDYLKRRGLSGQIAKVFGLGYAPEGWRHLAGVFPDYASPLLTESGLVIEHADEKGQDGQAKRYDRFRDRIMFPIRNVKGECIGFGGRVLDKGEPKYLNSPETPVFSKGRELYGLFEARTAIRQHGYALVTEGYMDVVALAQLGFANAVATLGTACTPDHVQKLFRFTDAVVFSFDGDAAGRRAARKALDAALPWASDTRSVKFLFLPAEHDPDSYIREHGTEAFAERVKEAVPLSRFLLEAAAADCDLKSAEGRARMASQARPLWTALPEGALKRQLLGEIAHGAGLDTTDLERLWSAPTGRAGSGTPGQRRAAGPDDGAPPRSDNERAWRPRQAGGPGPSDRQGRYGRSERAERRGPAGARRGLVSREDRALGLLLSNPAAWDALSADDHHLLAELPGAHGVLFAWLESQIHEHGPQPWAVLREILREQPHEALAHQAVEQVALTPGAEQDAEELAHVMLRLRIDRLKVLENEAIARAGSDPAELRRYADIQAQRKALEHQIGASPV